MKNLRSLKRLLFYSSLPCLLLSICMISVAISHRSSRDFILSSLNTTNPSKMRSQLKSIPGWDKMTELQTCNAYFGLLLKNGQNLNIEDYLKMFESKDKLIQSVSYIKTFLNCYVKNDFKVSDHSVEQKLLPFFSYNNDTKLRIADTTYHWDDKLAYWNNFSKQYYSSSGIALTLHPAEIPLLFKFLRTLALVGNKLPIEIIHKGEITADFQNYILSENSLKSQKIKFVDVGALINPDYMNMFKRFSNKWLAMIFSSFEEVILMDVDVIPLIPPEKFLDFAEYEETGCLLFKDRFLPSDKLSQNDIIFLQELIKTGANVPPEDKEEVDWTLPSFPIKYKHLVDSGVVVMDKKIHLAGLLISVTLQYWYRTSSIFYGDKELFWLGQLIAQDDFSIYDVNLSIVGSLTSEGQICSSQLGHLSHDRDLLWINGGLLNCKKLIHLEKDFHAHEHLRLKYENVDNLRDYYRGALQINASIIPSEWIYTTECTGYRYCAQSGEIVEFDVERTNFFNMISQEWNKN